MLTAIFLITTIICAYAWLKSTICLHALMVYFISKGYPKPEPEVLEECVSAVMNRMLHPRKQSR